MLEPTSNPVAFRNVGETPWLEVVGWVCLVWYLVVQLVCVIGYFQMYVPVVL